MPLITIANKSKYACGDQSCGAIDCRTCYPTIKAVECVACGELFDPDSNEVFSDDYCHKCMRNMEPGDGA